MSTNFKFFKNNEKIKINSEHDLSYPIKLCTIEGEDIIFILNNKKELFYGTCIKNVEKYELNISLILYKDDIIDIECYSSPKLSDYYSDTDSIYLIRENGCIYKTDKSKFVNSTFEEIIIQNKTNEKLKISSIHCSDMGLLFTPFDRLSIFGLGSFGAILQSPVVHGEPQEIELPNNEKLIQLTSGQNFVVLLTQQTRLYNYYLLFDTDSHEFSKFAKCLYSSLDIDLSDLMRKKWSDIYMDYENCISHAYGQIKNYPDTEQFYNDNQDLFSTEFNILVLNNYGNILKNTRVYTFGSINNSIINGKKLHLINKISNKGIKNISTNNTSTLALTLNGYLYNWDVNDLYDIKKVQKAGIYDAVNCDAKLNGNNNNNGATMNMEILYNNGLLVNSNNQKLLFNTMLLKNDECATILPAILNHHDYKIYLFNTIKNKTEISELYDQAQIHLEDNLILLNKLQTNTTAVRSLTVCVEYLINIDFLMLKSLHDIIYFDHNVFQLAIYQFNKELLHLYKLFIKLLGQYNIYDINFESIGKTFQNYMKILKTFYVNFDIDNTKLLDLVMDCNRFYYERLRLAIVYSKETLNFWKNNKDLKLKLGESENITLERYYIADNSKRPISMNNNLNIFTKSNIILFNDILCYITKNTQYVYPINLIWLHKYERKDNEFQIITPDDVFDVTTKNSYDKEMWLMDLRKFIYLALNGDDNNNTKFKLNHNRYGKYKFNRNNPRFAECEYEGEWYFGKMHGKGVLNYANLNSISTTASSSATVASPKSYSGQFHNNYIQGYGLMKFKSSSALDDEYYQGNFVADKYHGHGSLMLKSLNYEGYFKNGIYQGYGSLTIQTQTEQSTYHGEFLNNQKSGYGVLDDHITGIKYIGMFSNNKKNGSGILITSDGNYYEGLFTNDILMGHGLAIFQNGTYYIGELTVAGPNGKGNFYFPDNKINDQGFELDENKIVINGNILKGTLWGSWDNVKIAAGFLEMNQEFFKIPESTDQLSINPNKKFASIFKEWLNDVFEQSSLKNKNEIYTWKKIQQYQVKSKRKNEMRLNNFKVDRKLLINSNILDLNTKTVLKSSPSYTSLISVKDNEMMQNSDTISLMSIDSKISNFSLNSTTAYDEPLPESTIPTYLTQIDSVQDFKQYLINIFSDEHHPLCILSNKLSTCFYSTYGCWKMKPLSILCNTAIREWNAIIFGIYDILQAIFPSLTKSNSSESEIITANTLLYPILLTENIYSSLFVLYASKYSHYDEIYRQRILICERKTDAELIKFLQIDDDIRPIINHHNFVNAIECLKIFKREYNLNEMLRQIENTFDLIDETNRIEHYAVLNADNLLTLMIYLIIKSNIPSLGAELYLLEDLMGNDMNLFLNSHCSYCFTIIKASYQHILSSDFIKDN